MAWVSEAQIEAARAMSCIEYIKRFESSRLEKASARNEWQLKDHDSFKINEITSAWHWKSRDIGGYNALQFLIAVNGMEFTEAVQFLSDQNPSYIPPEATAKIKPDLVLPERNPNNRRIINYLGGRGISDPVIHYCIRLGILYESRPYHNAVFVGYDDKKVPRYAFLRGIYDNKKPFKLEPPGSDKGCPFYIPPEGQSVRVAVYEAAIDAMAHMTLEQGRADKYRLSLGGVNVPREGQQWKGFKLPRALEGFLSCHPEVRELELCTDNDFAGRWACEQLMKAYGGRYKVIANLPQTEGADYGDLARIAMEAEKPPCPKQQKDQITTGDVR